MGQGRKKEREQKKSRSCRNKQKVSEKTLSEKEHFAGSVEMASENNSTEGKATSETKSHSDETSSENKPPADEKTPEHKSSADERTHENKTPADETTHENKSPSEETSNEKDADHINGSQRTNEQLNELKGNANDYSEAETDAYFHKQNGRDGSINDRYDQQYMMSSAPESLSNFLDKDKLENSQYDNENSTLQNTEATEHGKSDLNEDEMKSGKDGHNLHSTEDGPNENENIEINESASTRMHIGCSFSESITSKDEKQDMGQRRKKEREQKTSSSCRNKQKVSEKTLSEKEQFASDEKTASRERPTDQEFHSGETEAKMEKNTEEALYENNSTEGETTSETKSHSDETSPENKPPANEKTPEHKSSADETTHENKTPADETTPENKSPSEETSNEKDAGLDETSPVLLNETTPEKEIDLEETSPARSPILERNNEIVYNWSEKLRIEEEYDKLRKEIQQKNKEIETLKKENGHLQVEKVTEELERMKQEIHRLKGIEECKNNIEHQCEELYKKLEEMNTNNIQIADENRCLKDKNDDNEDYKKFYKLAKQKDQEIVQTIRNLEDEKECLQRDTDNLSAQIETLKGQLSNLKAENENLHVNNEQNQRILDDVNMQLERSTSENDSLKEQNKQLMEEQSMLQSEVDRFRDEREQIEMEKKNLLTNKYEQESRVTQLESTINEMRETQNDYKELFRRIKPEKDKGDEQIRILTAEIGDLRSAKEDLSVKLDSKEESITQLMAEKDTMNSDIERYQQSLQSVESLMQESTSKNSALEERIVTLEQSVQSGKEKNKRLQNERDKNKEEINWLKQEKWNYDQEKQRIEASNDELNVKLTFYETNLQEQKDAMTPLQCLVDEKSAECSQLQSELETYRNDEHRMKQLQDILIQTEREKNKKEEKIKHLKAELATIKAETHAKEIEVAQQSERLIRQERRLQECSQNHDERNNQLSAAITEYKATLIKKDKTIEQLKIETARLDSKARLLEASQRQELNNAQAKEQELQAEFRAHNQTKIKIENMKLSLERKTAESNQKEEEIKRLQNDLVREQATLQEFYSKYGNLPLFESKLRQLNAENRSISDENKQLKERITSFGSFQTTFYNVQEDYRRVSAELQNYQVRCSMMEQKNRDSSNQCHQYMEEIQNLSSTELSLKRSMLRKDEENDELNRRLQGTLAKIDSLEKTLKENQEKNVQLLRQLNTISGAGGRTGLNNFPLGNLGLQDD